MDAEKDKDVKDEKEDPFDEKLLSNKKKYRGGKSSNGNAPRSKRRRAVAPLPMETEEN